MEMALELPQNFVELDQDETMYLDGGMNAWQRAGIIAAVAVVGTAVAAAITVGQFWLAGKLMGFTIKGFANQLGSTKVAGVIATNFGLSFAGTYRAVRFLVNGN